MSTINSLGSSMSLMMQAMSMQRSGQQNMFSKVDTDGNGTVGQSELTTFAQSLSEKTGTEINTDDAISTYDADGDGGLSQEEMEAMMAAYMPSPSTMNSFGQNGGGDKMQIGSMPSPPDKGEMFSKVDTDGSGTIDETELTSFAKDLAEKTGGELNVEDSIATYDTNGDGALSQEEMDTMMTAQMPMPPTQATAAYEKTANSGTNDSEVISKLLLSLLNGSNDEEQLSSYVPLDVQA